MNDGGNVKSNSQGGNGAALMTEILIMPDGRVLAHNLTPVFTTVLVELNPDDPQFSPRRKHATCQDHAI